jgi:uncharacterized membrane protein YphA (DoxX/SURF4 family)
MPAEPRSDAPWWTLRLTFGVVAFVAGLDKFTNILTDWTQYLNPLALEVVPVSAETFMRGVGVVEMLVGVLMFTRFTRLAAYVMAGWLAAIAVNLLTMGAYYDVAVRDLVMAVGAFTLARLTEQRAVAIEDTRRLLRRDERMGRPMPLPH